MRQEEYRELQYSDDPILRNYWWDARTRGIETRTKNARSKGRTAALNGVEVKVHAWPNLSIQQIYLCGVTLNILVLIVKLDLEKLLWVYCFLSDKPE
jgi:hypothetical protein